MKQKEDHNVKWEQVKNLMILTLFCLGHIWKLNWKTIPKFDSTPTQHSVKPIFPAIERLQVHSYNTEIKKAFQSQKI